MTKQKFFASITLALVFAASCSKKSDPAPWTGCLLTKITTTYSTGVVTDAFSYDASGVLDRHTLIRTFTGSPTTLTTYSFAYANGAVVSMTEAVQGGVTTVTTWSVDANRLVTKITEGDVNAPKSESTYTYDLDGNLKTWSNKGTNSTVNLNALYGNGQLVSATIDATSPGFSLNEPFTYSNFDSKNSPYSLLAKAIGQRFFVSETNGNVNPEFLFKSNPANSESDYRTNSGQNSHISITFTYEYNSQNYPTKITQTQAGSSTPVVYTFEYTNCN